MLLRMVCAAVCFGKLFLRREGGGGKEEGRGRERGEGGRERGREREEGGGEGRKNRRSWRTKGGD